MPYNNFYLVAALKPRMNTDIYYIYIYIYIYIAYCAMLLTMCSHYIILLLTLLLTLLMGTITRYLCIDIIHYMQYNRHPYPQYRSHTHTHPPPH